MKHLIIALLATALCTVCGGIAEAHQGLPTQDTLHEMGLSGMQIMSDSEALDIRGFGYDPWHGYGKNAKKSTAVAYGHSYASIGHGRARAHTKDGFYTKGHHEAKGEHGSKAGIVVKRKGGMDYGGGGGGNMDAASRKGGSGMKGGGGPPKKSYVSKVVVFAGGFSKASAH